MLGKISKILLIVGILVLIGILFLILKDPLKEVRNFSYWYRFLVMLFIGWLLTILGAVFISQRSSAWTFFLMGFYLYFFSFYGVFSSNDAGMHAAPLVLSIITTHILLGLILGIISFLESRKRKNR